MHTLPLSNNLHSEEVVKQHGLSLEEYYKIFQILGREPNFVELGIFSVMWSEHCSYKSTRLHLKKLHTEEEWVICGPGENAGIIDIGDNDAIIFKMESHNHPSYIEPYQGAATGVGGILRDVFTMGARPIAIADSLRFGEKNHKKTNHLLNGVISGISGYGNCVGVPNVTGDTIFHKSYNDNILVNAMCVGHVKKDKIFYSAASKVGAKVVYVGAKTGRDGIHGATMASQEFTASSEEKRPTVQVGDPFKEKLLIEACLELMQKDIIIAIQDMGAAGLTSSSLEMADKGNTGITLNLDLVPQREKNMTPYEMMLSESQERMLIVIKPEKEVVARDIFRKWDLDFAIIGEITNSKKLILTHQKKNVANIPITPLVEEAPIYNREWEDPIIPEKYLYQETECNLKKALIAILTCPDVANKKNIYEQYDSLVMNDTIKSHNISSGIVRIFNTKKAVAITTDCTPRYVEVNPYMGTIQAVIESYRNLIVLGAKPLAITNCLNFGNPEKPEIMGQIVKSIEAIADCSKILKYPVISGNVSLYNETNGKAIQPCPNIGAVGLIKDTSIIVPNYLSYEKENIFIIGETESELGSSLFLREYLGQEKGDMPNIDINKEIDNSRFATKLLQEKLITSINDVSDGGLLTLLSKMSFIKNIGFDINNVHKIQLSDAEFYFSETSGRYVITSKKSKEVLEIAEQYGIKIFKIGKTVKDVISFSNYEIKIEDLKKKFDAVI